MATKIDTIEVNNVEYEITLPSTAALTVSTLTVNGEATITGELSTSAGVTISKDLTVGGNLTVTESSSIRYINSETLTVQNAVVRLELKARSISSSGIICPELKASKSAGSLTVPTTSGTLARLQDFEPISETDINLLFI